MGMEIEPTDRAPDTLDDDAYGDTNYIPGATLRVALQYARAAAAKEKENDVPLACVVLHPQRDLQRLVVAARDGYRWHLAFVPLPPAVKLRGTLFLRLSSVDTLIDALKLWVRRGDYCNVRTVGGSDLRWQIKYRPASEPTVLELEEHDGGRTDAWEPPPFRAGTLASLAEFSAKHLSAALAIKAATDAKIGRQEVDQAGRLHINIVDSGGAEIARAVLVPLGLRDGVPESPQTAIAGTLTPLGATPGPKPVARKKAANKKPARAGAKKAATKKKHGGRR